MAIMFLKNIFKYTSFQQGIWLSNGASYKQKTMCEV